MTTSPVMPAAGGPDDRRIGVVDDDGVLAAQADAGPSVPGELHGPDSCTGPLTRGLRRRARARTALTERTGGACPIGASGPREGGWNLRGVPRRTIGAPQIQPQPTRTVKKRTPRTGEPTPGRAVVAAAMAQSAAMTATLRRSGGLAALSSRSWSWPPAAPRPRPRRPDRGAHARRRRRRPRAAGLGRAQRVAVRRGAVGSPSGARATTPTGSRQPGPDDPSAAIYDAIEAQVAASSAASRRPRPVERGVFDTARAVRLHPSSVREGEPGGARPRHGGPVQGAGAHARRTQSLEDLYLELLTSQVARPLRRRHEEDVRRHQSGEIGPAEKFTYAHEYTHALQDQAFDLRDVMGEATDQSDRALARVGARRGRRDAADDPLGAAAPDARQELLRGRGRVDPAIRRRSLDRMPAILKDPLLFPYTSGLTMTLGAFAGRRLRRRRRAVPQPAGLDRAGPPPREARGARGAGRRSPSPTTSPSRLGRRLDGLAPGHVRRAAARDRPPRRRRERHRRRRAPAGAATGSRWSRARTARTRSCSTPRWDTEADADEFAAALAADVARARGRGPVAARSSARRRIRVVADRRSRRTRWAGSRTSSGSRGRPAVRPGALHRLGRGDPEQLERVRERRLRRQGQREPLRRALRLLRVHDPRVAVERVELRRELGRVGRDALRLLGQRRRPRRPPAAARRPARAPPRARRRAAPRRPPPVTARPRRALRRIEAIRACAYWT